MPLRMNVVAWTGMDPATHVTAPRDRRLRNLLKTHQKLLNPELQHPEQGAVLIDQDEIADFLLLVQQGCLGVEIQQSGHAHQSHR